MKYKNIVTGTFIERPNRFIAICNIDGKKEISHVKNTGRCKELLVNGATVYLQVSDNPNRKTKFDLIAVQKGDRLINIDSQIVNYAFLEYLPNLFKDIVYVKPECKYGNSRFDVYVETKTEKIFAEIKGVTLENDGIVRFPDAPTERGIKHLKELKMAVTEGYRACVVFIIQMSDVNFFEPNKETHPEFADELKRASENGVEIYAFDCIVKSDEIKLNNKIKVNL